MTTMSSAPVRVDISQYAGKETLLRLIRQEYQSSLEMLTSCSDEEWNAQTPCDMWQVRDLAGHLLDASFSYLGYFKQGEHGWPTEEPRGMLAYGDALGKSALAFRDVYRWELLGRLDACNELLFDYFDRLGEADWMGRLIPHKWVGPVPSFMMATFQLMDYSVHNWDLRRALGRRAEVDEESANTLVPFMFGLMQLCFSPERAADVDLTIGVEIAPEDHWTVRVSGGTLTYAPGRAEQPNASFSFPCNEFCLDVYQRIQGGQASGDQASIDRFRQLFFTI
jgi:uncharacterized protein (TIGR03083 family)